MLHSALFQKLRGDAGSKRYGLDFSRSHEGKEENPRNSTVYAPAVKFRNSVAASEPHITNQVGNFASSSAICCTVTPSSLTRCHFAVSLRGRLAIVANWIRALIYL